MHKDNFRRAIRHAYIDAFQFTYLPLFVFIYNKTYTDTPERMHTHTNTYVCMYVCMYECMYVERKVHRETETQPSTFPSRHCSHA